MIRRCQWFKAKGEPERLQRGRAITILCLISSVFLLFAGVSLAETTNGMRSNSIDRTQLVEQQIALLKDRYKQGEMELQRLQLQEQNGYSPQAIEKASRNLLNKAALDTSVAKSNVDSINIEVTDCEQTIAWLEKSIQDAQNQLGVLNIFGSKIIGAGAVDASQWRSDLSYGSKLLKLEKLRLHYLVQLQQMADNTLALRNEHYNNLNDLLKSRNLVHLKQQQDQAELAYQVRQNHWLQQLNNLSQQLTKTDPSQNRAAYTQLERDIFNANENANVAYVYSLLARYKDQIQQMRLAILRSKSISLLSEISDQTQLLSKQIDRLDEVLQTRMSVLDRHISYMGQKKTDLEQIKPYVGQLQSLKSQYLSADTSLKKVSSQLAEFRDNLDRALQAELASRQGLTTFNMKSIVDLGKEILLVPALTFQMIKILMNYIYKVIGSATPFDWVLFAGIEFLIMVGCYFIRERVIARHADLAFSTTEITTKWLCWQWVRYHFIDVVVIVNALALLCVIGIPPQNLVILFYLSAVWLVFKSLFVVARLALFETTHDHSGSDVRLYQGLRWLFLLGGLISAATVFVNCLPLIYDLKTFCDCLFLMLLLVVSVILLRSKEVVPNLILAHFAADHNYLTRSIRFIAVLVPLLMMANALIGLYGYVNLIMSIAWYEGIFLLVTMAYLVMRGLLSEGMEQLSQLVIQYLPNGWLLNEAFLKPLDKLLRIMMFLSGGALLFLLYGWDKQSPIVERLWGLLNYQFLHVLNTSITVLSVIELSVVISVFYWSAKWTREFVYRLLLSRTKDMGIRNSIAILSQYSVVVIGAILCLRVLGIDLKALTMVASAFAFGVGLGLRDLANNFACGFLILLERPLRVGDIVNVNGVEGEVAHIGGRAVTIRTWDHMDLVVPNAEIFNKSFTNWTARDNIVRAIGHIKISRHDNPHEVQNIITAVLKGHANVLPDPVPEVFLKHVDDFIMEFEFRYHVNIRQVRSRASVMSLVLLGIWDAFGEHGIKPPCPQQQIYLRDETALQAPQLRPVERLSS